MRRLALIGALLALPASASAATRYVAPGGADTGGCVREVPCSPTHAIAGAGSETGDTVVVLPGTYDIAPLVVPRPLLITARPDGPRPVFRSAAGVALTVGPDAPGTIVEHLALRAAGEGAGGIDVQSAAVVDDVRVTVAGGPCLRSAVEGVRLEDSAFALTGLADGPCVETTGRDTTWGGVDVTALNGAVAAVFAGDGALDDVEASGRLTGLVLSGTPDVHRLTASGADRGLVLQEGDALVTDSVAVARQGGTAVLGAAGAHHLVNLTAWGAGKGSSGIRAVNGAQLTVKNTIARGAGVDLAAEPATTGVDADCPTFTGCAAGTILVDHSNYVTARGVTDNGANQSGSPRFVSPSFFDFRLRRRSPAVDAGNFEINAASADRAGRFRWLGRTPDIGAYEFAPPRRPLRRRDVKAPVLRAVALSSRRLPVVRRGTAFSAAKRPARGAGTLLRWFVSEKADIVVTVRRPGVGRPIVGTIVHPANLGWGTLKLNGRIDARPLPKGRYVLEVLARDVSQNLSAARRFAVDAR